MYLEDLKITFSFFNWFQTVDVFYLSYSESVFVIYTVLGIDLFHLLFKCVIIALIFFFSLLHLWYFSFSFLKLFIYSFSSFLNNLPRGLLTLFFSCCIVSDSLVTPWAVAHQAPLSMGLSRQEYWSEFPFPTPGIFPSQGSNLCLPHWQAGSLALSHRKSPC